MKRERIKFKKQSKIAEQVLEMRGHSGLYSTSLTNSLNFMTGQITSTIQNFLGLQIFFLIH